MTRRTRILATVGAVLGLLLVLLLVLPLLFRDRIAARVKTAVNDRLNARVDWRSVGVGFFRDFPNLTLTLEDLTAVGVAPFEGDTLAVVPRLHVSVSLPSVLRSVTGGGTLVVRTVELDAPRLALVRLASGEANWDIVKDTPPSQESGGRPLDVSLRRLAIEDARLDYDDRRSGIRARVANYDQTLAGDFAKQVVDVRTTAGADSVTVALGGTPYLNEARLTLDLDAEADLGQKVYTLRTTELRLNDLALAVTGSARSVGENLGLDLAFKAPSTDFRSILSLVPVVYAHEFEKVRTSGTVAVDGRVQGEYGDAAFPSFAVNAKVDDAAFQYSDLPLPARGIVVDLKVTNPGGSLDSTLVRLDRFRAQIGRNPVEATLALRTPISDPEVDARVKGTVDLADLRRTVKLEKVEQLAGTVSADAAVRTRRSWVERKQYERVAASGRIDVAGVTVRGEALPQPLTVEQASVTLAPQNARLERFRGTVGSSDLEASGTLENMLSYALREDTLKGTVKVSSRKFVLDEWRSDEPTRQVIPVPPRLDLVLDATMAQLVYGNLTTSDARGRVRVKDERATLEDFRLKALGGELGVAGFYDTRDSTKPAFDVAFRMLQVEIPQAFRAFTTIQALAPVAKYASGEMTVALKVAGALAPDMKPVFSSLDGAGTVQTSQVAIKDFPALERIVNVTKLQLLNDPTMRALAASFQIRDGRLVMRPFDVTIAGVPVTISGSNGFDQTLQYTLGLRVPRSALGGGADQALSGLLSRAGNAGIDLGSAAEIPLGITVAGTVSDPQVSVDVKSLATSVASNAKEAVKTAVASRASAEALQLVAEAEKQAASIRAEAESLAARLKLEGYTQADSLSARAGDNALRRVAAEAAAGKLRRESDRKAESIVAAAGRRADSLVASARRRAEALGGDSTAAR